MKTEKNHIYFTKILFIFLKIGLWALSCFIYFNFSFLIPITHDGFFRELIIFLFLAAFINIHTTYLFPRVSKKHNLLYILFLIISIAICTLFEILLFSEIFDPSYYPFLDRKKIYIATISNIAIRNLALFIFFLWIEYFFHLIQLLREKDLIHQKEISLLIEKQEFEKNFSRKKLLLHYFFNILELVRINSTAYYKNYDLLNKIKFILYYFLVDAEQEKIKLDKEIAFYQYYLDLENLRHKENVIINFNVLGQIEDINIIPLLFEPLIGNAIKYAKRDGTGYVNITFDATHFSVLNFYCNNNYSIHSLNKDSSESGLKILIQRLELCYKNNYTLVINQSDDFYEVTLSIILK